MNAHAGTASRPPAARVGAGGGRSELLLALEPAWPLVRRAALFALVGSLLLLAPSVYMLEVYDRVVNSRSLTTLVMLTLMVVLAYGVMEALDWLRGEMLQAAGREADRRLGARIFDVTFEARLRQARIGLLQPFADWRTLREFLATPFVPALMETPASLVFLVLVFVMNPLLGWVTSAGALLQVGIAWLNERASQPKLAEANRTAIAAQAYADASLRNAEVIEAMGMLPSIHARWIGRQQTFLDLQARASLAAGSLQSLSRLVQQVMGSALLGLGAWLSMKNQLLGGPGMMIVASIIGGRVLAPLVQMVAQWRQVIAARDAWARLAQLLGSLPPRPQAMPLPPPQGELSVEQLVAAAPGTAAAGSAPAILRGLQFTLAPGELLAVIGPSASGKTTLARLLVGLWPASAGKVRLDGVDVHLWNKTELGPHIGYLPQSVELFEGSVAENIARFGDADPARVRAAAALVGLHELIEELPQGYETLVGRDGAVLSGGMRQRVALARALYGDPAFVVLDEPDSSLDEAGDLALRQALLQLKARRGTAVVVTHRHSVLSVVDKVLLLAEGKQQAFGPRDQVLDALRKAQQQMAAAALPRGDAP